MTRRLLALSTAAALLSVGPATVLQPPAQADPRTATSPTAHDSMARELGRLERSEGARIGVLALDTGTGRVAQYRGDERFAHASTFKALLAGAVLDRLDRRGLQRRVHWTSDELVSNSPVTSQHVADGLTVRQLIEASITVSDNTAANLLLEIVGGPAGLQRALRGLGDRTTSTDRWEPELNSAIPGDRRDTTTPRALAASFREYVLGDVLPPADRRLLRRDLDAATTGFGLVRAGVPSTWRVGDKSGSAEYGSRNDVALVRPPGRAPIVIAVLTTHHDADAATDDALVEAATRAAVRRLTCP